MRAVVPLLLLFSVAVSAGVNLVVERELASGTTFDAQLVSYDSDGLKVYAMVAVPAIDPPAGGFPVVVANHGYVPDPRRYGITADGKDARPGDYYRSVPELFASRGFLVVLPDYRGHSSSEGYDQIKDQDAAAIELYADDVVALIDVVGEIDFADPNRVFLWSHSLGGAVSIRVQLARENIKAASYWSTMPVDELSDEFGGLRSPIAIHHGKDDSSTRFQNSVDFVRALERSGRQHGFHAYDTADHFFTGEMRELAADRDADFFLSTLEVER